MNTQDYLSRIAKERGIPAEGLQLPACELVPENIRTIMISEVPPKDPADGFYSNAPQPDYVKTALGLFAQAGVPVQSMADILKLGIYVTTAVKTPKTGYTVDPEIIQAHLPLLQAELSLFPHLKVIMLMGDVAKKAVNMIAKAQTRKNIIPSKPTGGIRGNEYYWGEIRVFPSYIMTGKNLLIEPFKRDCVADDIRRMMELIT